MPSRLITTTANQLQGSLRVKSQARAAVAQITQGIQTIEAQGPFHGYQPDIDPNLTDGTAFDDLTNVLCHAEGENHGEVIGLPDGYRQLDWARLPLGDTSPPASPGSPIVRLDQLSRFSPTGGTTPGEMTGQFVLAQLAVTAGDGTTAASGNMYRMNASGQWTLIGSSASMAAATRQLSATINGRTGSNSMPDSCVAPFGATARAVVGGAGADGQSGPINEPAWIFTNDKDEVMVFPSSTTETLAATHAYEPLTSVAALDGGTTLGFKAKSCETWNGRVYFLNTSEAGTRRQRRLRRTAKFTCDPDPAIVGSGFYDFQEFQGEGLRAETLGDVLAIYFSDGVAFVRPTGVPTSPDEPQILSTERGLLSTHSVTAIGRNVHFGIFTDGWWMIDQSGRWQELGVVNLDGKIVPKWRRTFYQQIPSDQRHRIQCYYDQPNNLIYIIRPTISQPQPEEVWIYDPTSDRVFIESYPVTTFGTYTPLAVAGTTIGGLPGTIGGLPGTIGSYAPVAGFPKVRVHGDLSGFVYQHSRDLVGYDPASNTGVAPLPQEPSWNVSFGLRSPAGYRHQCTVDRVSLEYFNHQNPNNVSIEVRGPSADGSQTRTVLLDGGNLEDVRSKDAWFRLTTQSPGLQLSGVGEFHLRRVSVDVWADPLEPRGL